MRHTLVAAFATVTDANRTRGDLMARGIAREHIHAVGADSADIHGETPYSTTDSSADPEHHESKVAHFFKSLFGNEPHEDHRRHATAYPEAVRRGALVIAVDVYDDDELVKVRDALEYNGAMSIDDQGTGGTGAMKDYAGPTSPYAGATGGDSHLDKHFVGSRPAASSTSGAMASGERYSESERPGAGGPIGSASGSGQTSDGTSRSQADGRSADTGRYDVGSAGKRAGTDYPPTTATTAPTGAGTTGHGSSVDTAGGAQGRSSGQAGPCSDRVCVIRRHDQDSGLG